jgi:hypothetical protein
MPCSATRRPNAGQRWSVRTLLVALGSPVSNAARLVRGSHVAELVVRSEQHQPGAVDAEQPLGLVDHEPQGLRQAVVGESGALKALDALGQRLRVDRHAAPPQPAR